MTARSNATHSSHHARLDLACSNSRRDGQDCPSYVRVALLDRGAAHLWAIAADRLLAVRTEWLGFPLQDALLATVFLDLRHLVDADHKRTARLTRIGPRKAYFGDADQDSVIEPIRAGYPDATVALVEDQRAADVSVQASARLTANIVPNSMGSGPIMPRGIFLESGEEQLRSDTNSRLVKRADCFGSGSVHWQARKLDDSFQLQPRICRSSHRGTKTRADRIR